MRTATHYENTRLNSARFAEPEEGDTLDAIEDLFRQRRNAITLAKTRRMQLRTFDDCADMQLADRRILLSGQLAAALTARAEAEIKILNAMKEAVTE